MLTFVLGYSLDPTRYSNLAFNLLKKFNHHPVGINPSLSNPTLPTLAAAFKKFGRPHTLTIYVNPNISSALSNEIIKINPQRVIFNPGSENPSLQVKLEQLGVEVITGCTLVMLKTNQF